jgi:hypothetical protein
MFARNSNAFKDYSSIEVKHLDHSQLNLRLNQIQEILFPAVNEKMKSHQRKLKKHFDTHKNTLKNPFPDGSYVMKRDPTRTSTLQPYYEGPFKVLKRTSGGSYVLQDSTGALLPRNAAPSQLKIISHAPDNKQASFEVDAILDHRGTVNYDRSYLVKWKHDHPHTWIPEQDFDDLDCISAYCKRRSTAHDFQPGSFLKGDNVMISPSQNHLKNPKRTTSSKHSKKITSSNENQQKIKIRLRYD